MTKNQIFKPVAYLLVFLAVILLVTTFFPKTYTFNGSVIEPRMDAYDFSLSVWGGEIFSVSDYRDSVLVMFFGYTNCPDVCPTTLVDFKNMIAELDTENDSVQFVMITVDPDRDTPEKISQYVAGFDEEILGLSGSIEELQPIWDNYFIARYPQKEGEEDNYLVDHTGRIFVVDKSGALRVTFPLGMPIDAMVSDIEFLINE